MWYVCVSDMCVRLLPVCLCVLPVCVWVCVCVREREGGGSNKSSLIMTRHQNHLYLLDA